MPTNLPLPPPPRSAFVIAALAQLKMGRLLRPLVLVATGVSVYFHLRQFLSDTFMLRYSPDLAYVTLLAAYAGHLEIRRWIVDPEVMEERGRRGELFVVFWWLFYYVTLMAANHVASYRVPDGLLTLSIEVTTIFFGTLASRHLAQRRQARFGPDPMPPGGLALEAQILDRLGRAGGPVTSRALEAQCGVSRSTVLRTLKRLEAEGKVEWVRRNENDPEGGFRRRPGGSSS